MKGAWPATNHNPTILTENSETTQKPTEKDDDRQTDLWNANRAKCI